ncbi:MAG: acyl-CoA dehydratase activase [bacterium]|nr:acyl-CoA dehydratase activase [bacterium]
MNPSYFVGIDIGSTTIKAVLIDRNQTIQGQVKRPTGGNYHQNAKEAFDQLLAEADVDPEAVGYVISTGYGRKLFKLADETISEITANARGAVKVGEGAGTVRTVINIGGQDLKIIALDEDGHCSNFAMNDKCAAGTGRFLEMVAVNLEVELEELGQLHADCQATPVVINSTCTVFADSEIISILAKGHSKAEVVAGVHYSIARRIARLTKRVGVDGIVLFDGGPALNPGLVEAVQTELMRELLVPQYPQMTTAWGAAILALEAAQELHDA